MALTADRNTPQRLDRMRNSDPVEAASVIYVGSMVAINTSGNAVAASATAANITRGVSTVARADNSAGAAGAINVDTERGVFQFANSASADLLARTDIGATCYVVDAQTVAKTDGSGARPVAGVVRDVDANGVWVEF
ncbi:MAG: hypothetical protein JSS41_04675 [Proteobacteria bacterium]|nr:hypothetical protein [Pseudomonadota bacterium]